MMSDKKNGGTSGEPLDPQLHAWLDGELEGEERAAVEERLGSDPIARGRLDLLSHCEERLATSTPDPPPGMADRIQRAIRMDQRSRRPGVAAVLWGRKTPTWLWAGGLGAASVAALTILFLVGPTTKPAEQPEPVAVASSTAAPVVDHEFLLEAPGAKEVCLVGDFNGWEVCRTPLRENDPGVWRIRVHLPRGRHEYMFVVDGRWVTDPRAAMRIDDGFGSQNAVVLL